ncbi:MoxR-like ATPase [Kineococcus xinjiangensis]|uniref:MoxR-like ATPase n=1 Tax=Kineococcus xinjiangensis TaxID=512762 RepID=A0A2S6IJY5_9ACTN|nr:MoxR family ATPase [Kineococcus xinjiangensis]PPK94544.1 MoxR-like ATPase [Kineococcus xinjiangensis]
MDTTPAAAARALVDAVEQVVRGRRAAVELVATAVLAGGHVLVEDVPGSGKTTMAKAFARAVGAGFGRVQATSDLLPADITGGGVWDAGQGAFRFVPGPVFSHVLLVDELNRTSPRSQSAFLEAMEEGAVTVDGVRHPLPDPFVVLATQNPVEQVGTYPLPEGQLDRFAVRVVLGPLSARDERQVVREQLRAATVDHLPPVTDPAGLRALRAAVRDVHVADAVVEHAVDVVRATRSDARVLLGASARAAITLVRCAQARAVLEGRDYATPGDVQALAVPVLAHRLVLAEPQHGTQATALLQQEVVARIVQQVPVALPR